MILEFLWLLSSFHDFTNQCCLKKHELRTRARDVEVPWPRREETINWRPWALRRLIFYPRDEIETKSRVQTPPIGFTSDSRHLLRRLKNTSRDRFEAETSRLRLHPWKYPRWRYQVVPGKKLINCFCHKRGVKPITSMYYYYIHSYFKYINPTQVLCNRHGKSAQNSKKYQDVHK